MTDTVTLLTWPQIKTCLATLDLIPLIEQGFSAYSNGDAIVPPVGELIFENPPGDTHIKYGYIKSQQYYVIKVASGFPLNNEKCLRSSQGVMLLFSQQTGALECVLLDEGRLTDIRTAIASMITLKYLSPKHIDSIGILGSGIQAGLQLEYLDQVSNCKNIVVWGRSPARVQELVNKFENSAFKFIIARTPAELASLCKVIITTTSATEPILQYADLQPGTHITALGSDTEHKIELNPDVLQHADTIVSDSIAQSKSRGEVFRARQEGCLKNDKLLELGSLISDPKLGRQNDQQITVADLTGVAVQDIMIATAIYNHHLATL